MNQEFRSAYKQLNNAQRQAVDAIDGPVLVIAGPGTGKTQLLSVRVANILDKTDTDPSSILCLTFTNFAATNMSERLQKLIGPSAHNVMIKTFHSFAAEIMNLYPDYFWNGARLQIAPDAVQIEIIQSILAKLPLSDPLSMKFAGSFTAINDVQQGLKLTKEAGLSPDKLMAMIEVNDSYIDLIEPRLVKILEKALSNKKLPELADEINKLPDQPIDEAVKPLISLSTVIKESLALAVATDLQANKTVETGKWKRRWLQSIGGQKAMHDERRRNSWWRALAGVYASYRNHLHQQGYYDYSDMLIEVISQLEQHPDLLAGIQEQCLYVLIDEFQDSNAAQMRLAHLITNSPSNEGQPNLMAVGDDDQTIFAFNGAELNNMLAFRRAYPKTKTILLTDNYRSTQAVLDFSQTIIEQADDRLVNRSEGLNKHLVAKNQPPRGSIAHLGYPTRENQLSALAKRIKQTWDTDQTATIAVLARQHASLRQLSSVLSSSGVPIKYEMQNDVLKQPLVEQLIILAEVVNALSQGDEDSLNYFLPRLLQSDAWQIKPTLLWKLALVNYARPAWLNSLRPLKNEQLSAIANWLEWLAKESANQPLAVMLEYFVGLRPGAHMTSPVGQYYLSRQTIDNQYLEGLSGLNVITRLTSEFALARTSKTTLLDFIKLIRLHRQLDRPITDDSWFISGEKAVQLLTVHKAKGLEFDTVFVLDAVDDHWRPRRHGRKSPANLPLQPYGEVYDDYVRLFYVAATRAKRSLIVSSFQFDHQGKPVLPTPLIGSVALENQASSSEENIDALEQSLTWPRLDNSDERSLLAPRLDSYRLSATGLLQFLDVSSGGPQHFLERSILRIPEIRTANMAYGTAVHRALQTAQQELNKGGFSLAKVQQSYANSLEKQQLPIQETKKFLQFGHDVLDDLFKLHKFKPVKGGQPEISLNDIEVGGVRLSGTLDNIVADAKHLLITDYKTGKPLTSFVTKDQTKAIKAWRHKNQLLFYCYLASRASRFKSAETMTGRMLYVEASKDAELLLELIPDQETLERLEQLIRVVWQHIMDLNFPDTRHYSLDIQSINNFQNDLLAGKI